MLNQLEADLRKRWRVVSLEANEVLRQGMAYDLRAGQRLVACPG